MSSSMSLKVYFVLFVLFISTTNAANHAKKVEHQLDELARRQEQQEKRIQHLENIVSKGLVDKLKTTKAQDFETTDHRYGNGNVSRRYSDLQKRGISANSICSFYVSLSHDHDLHLNTGVPVVFDDIRLKENNCYNSGDGEFVASMDGIYIFHWKITTHSGGKAGVHIKKNGQDAGGMSLLVKSFSGDTNRDGEVNHNSAADFAILRLQRGDHVNIATSLENSFIHAGHSGFGGFYLRG